MTEPLPEQEPEREPIEIFVEEEDGQLSIEPVEGEELSLGAWMERMPKNDQYRSLWWAWR
jgi:hypothetical protein